MKKTEALNILHTLTNINSETSNAKTVYWAARNLRKSNLINEYQDKIKEVQKDAWFSEYKEEFEKEGEKANEKYKEQLKLADDEIREFLDADIELTWYKIKISEYDGDTKLIPVLFDLFVEEGE